jgi:large subunit ribosomal protein L13
MRQTTIVTSRTQGERSWHVVDATGKRLGRLAAEVSQVLMGKHRPDYTAHVDTGDYVVVINAGAVTMTGKKPDLKVKTAYSGYPGGLRVETYRDLLERKPEFVVQDAVRRMLPKGMLGKQMLTKLKVYRDADHPHTAQRPTPLEV